MVLVGNGQSKQATRYSTFEFVHDHYMYLITLENYFSFRNSYFWWKGEHAGHTVE